MISLLFIILFTYVFFIVALIFGFTKMKPIIFYDSSIKTKFSIVVPFRNEAENLPKLLASLSFLDYPKELYEVMLIDDDSDDDILITNYNFCFTIIKNERKSNSPKKDAIETAIKIAKHDWIITTDADCLVESNWLKILDNYIQQSQKRMIVAGVYYLPKKGFLHAFQNLDFLSLQGVTIGSFGIELPFMCNGANFAYRKDFFYELNGFQGNEKIASGDDVFLLQKAIEKEKNAVGFCMHYQSTVKTHSVDKWSDLFFQRVRWASKSTSYSSFFGKTIALLVFGINLIWVLSFMLCVFNLFPLHSFLIYAGIKFLIDSILLFQASSYFKTRISWLLLSSFLYPFFSTSVAIYSLFGKYKWKGRQFKK